MNFPESNIPKIRIIVTTLIYPPHLIQVFLLSNKEYLLLKNSSFIPERISKNKGRRTTRALLAPNFASNPIPLKLTMFEMNAQNVSISDDLKSIQANVTAIKVYPILINLPILRDESTYFL